MNLCAVTFPPCPYLRLQGSEGNSMGRKHRGGAKKKALPTSSCPECADPRVWCVTHLFEGGEPEDVGADPSEGAPGFHAHLMVLGGPESPPQETEGEEVSPGLPEHQQPDNFDTFLEHYKPTDEQVSLGAQLLLGCSSNPDATMERLLMSMMGSLETYATAVEAGINY
jgi:hypothetical protein